MFVPHPLSVSNFLIVFLFVLSKVMTGPSLLLSSSSSPSSFSCCVYIYFYSSSIWWNCMGECYLCIMSMSPYLSNDEWIKLMSKKTVFLSFSAVSSTKHDARCRHTNTRAWKSFIFRRGMEVEKSSCQSKHPLIHRGGDEKRMLWGGGGVGRLTEQEMHPGGREENPIMTGWRTHSSCWGLTRKGVGARGRGGHCQISCKTFLVRAVKGGYKDEQPEKQTRDHLAC